MLDTRDTLGIIAGAGILPLQIIESCIEQNINFRVLGFSNQTDIATLNSSVKAIKLFEPYQLSSIIQYLKNNQVNKVVLAGKIQRINFNKLLFDRYGFRLLRIFLKQGFNDNSIFKTLVTFLENQGFEVIASNAIVPKILVEKGAIGSFSPKKCYMNDINRARDIIKTLGACDIGQALVIQSGLVLGIEAAEGTDALIERTAKLTQKSQQKPILVKMCKPIQDERVDLPCIGEQTINNLVKSNFAGVALEAGKSLILDRDRVIKISDFNKLFIYGIS